MGGTKKILQGTKRILARLCDFSKQLVPIASTGVCFFVSHRLWPTTWSLFDEEGEGLIVQNRIVHRLETHPSTEGRFALQIDNVPLEVVACSACSLQE